MAIDWKLFLPVFEQAGNIALLASGQSEYLPLTTAVESSINPLLLSLGQGKQDVTSELMLAYGTEIAVLELLKQKHVADPALLTKIEEYITAIQAAMAGWVKASSGFDPGNFTPVAPIP